MDESPVYQVAMEGKDDVLNEIFEFVSHRNLFLKESIHWCQSHSYGICLRRHQAATRH